MAGLGNNFYQGRHVAFLTQHGKQDLVRAPLEHALGCHLIHTEAYDTDQLGTFTRDVARRGSQLDAAREKAKIGMRLTAARLAIASEGSFGPDPFVGFTPWNTELLLWVDQDLGYEVQGLAQGPAQSLHRMIRTVDELHNFAREANFPTHHLTLRPTHAAHAKAHKGIRDAQHLVRAFHAAKAESEAGWVEIENDLRAFCNPTRQAVIRQATQDLIQKLRATCPLCTMPGFSRAEPVSGLPCRACARKTDVTVGEIWRCVSCRYEEQRPTPFSDLADPARCNYCNP